MSRLRGEWDGQEEQSGQGGAGHCAKYTRTNGELRGLKAPAPSGRAKADSCGNDRKKNKNNSEKAEADPSLRSGGQGFGGWDSIDGARFLLSHLCAMKLRRDGEPIFVAGLEKQIPLRGMTERKARTRARKSRSRSTAMHPTDEDLSVGWRARGGWDVGGMLLRERRASAACNA